MPEPKYRIWATLLDTWQQARDPLPVWQKYWGQSDNPGKTYEEFAAECEQKLLDACNRVYEVSEAAAKGTAFNDAVDHMLRMTKIPTDVVHIAGGTHGDIQERLGYHFDDYGRPVSMVMELQGFCFEFSYTQVSGVAAGYITRVGSESIRPASQVYTDGVLPTAWGPVLLYGYIDELMPTAIIDIKTTGSYRLGQFKSHWQHLVYPYCLRQHGDSIDRFEYDVLVWQRKRGDSPRCLIDGHYRETYIYSPERDEPRLREHVESLIEWIEAHRDKIDNPKLFNFREK